MIRTEPFGVTAAGEPVTRFTLQNAAGMAVSVLDYGCTIQRILVPDCAGRLVSVALGYEDLEGYARGSSFLGALVGRYANRIRGAAFPLNGKTVRLEPNDGQNHLHGVYPATVFPARAEGETLVFRRRSPDGEEGFPGNLDLEIRYTLREDNALRLTYLARTDADTVLNLTNHTYFNLNGQGDVLDHWLRLSADRFTESDAQLLPTGHILPVDGTPMDFRAGRRIGDGISSDFDQIRLARGYDHNFILRCGTGTLRPFAEAVGDRTGIRLEAFTTQPAVQLYTGNYLDEDAAPGARWPRYGGFCLETQHFPDAPNHPAFPSTVLRPGERYRHETVYRFSAAGRIDDPGG